MHEMGLRIILILTLALLACDGSGGESENIGIGVKLAVAADFAEVALRLAIADPEKAPYGRAAIQTLESLELFDLLEETFVFGENVSKTLELVETGSADAGFVAFPDLDNDNQARSWIVLAQMHEPIEQAAVVLSNAPDPDSADRWMDYLVSDPARLIIKDAGFRLP